MTKLLRLSTCKRSIELLRPIVEAQLRHDPTQSVSKIA